MTEVSCGCRLDVHEPTGARFNVFRCKGHTASAATRTDPDESYYANLVGVLTDNPPHVGEFVEAFGPLPDGHGDFLEVGCGISPYAKMIIDAGYRYHVLDSSTWAIEQMRKIPGVVSATHAPLESLDFVDSFQAILAAHVMEHVRDPESVLASLFRALKLGGSLYLVLPDDEDLANPDHRWFFMADSLAKMVRRASFVVDSVKVRRYVKHESFIYLKATKKNPFPFPCRYPGFKGNSWLYAAELESLIGLVGPRDRVLEIGSADGVTAAKIARERNESVVVSIDPYGPYPETNGFASDEVRLANWRTNANQANQMLWIGTVKSFHQFCREPFDIVLIDGDHSYNETFSDLLHAELLVRNGGMLVAHDYDSNAFPQVAAAVDRFCELRGWRIDETTLTLAVLKKEVRP